MRIEQQLSLFNLPPAGASRAARPEAADGSPRDVMQLSQPSMTAVHPGTWMAAEAVASAASGSDDFVTPIAANGVGSLPAANGPAASVASAPATLSMENTVDAPLFESQGWRLDTLPNQGPIAGELTAVADRIASGQTPDMNRYLLTGGEGIGKTATLRAIAGTFYTRGITPLEADTSNLSAEAVHAMFARAQGPTAVVLDDVGKLLTGAPALGALCSEIEAHPEVTVLASALKPENVDPTLLKLLGRQMEVQAPSYSGDRRKVLDSLVERQHFQVSPEVRDEIAGAMGGAWPGKLLATLELAQHLGGPAGITSESAREARLQRSFGPAREVTNPDWMFQLTVKHELGHLLVRHIFDQAAVRDNRPDHRPAGVDCVSFAPRGGSEAAVYLKPSGNPAVTFETTFAGVASDLAGRAAENQFGQGHVSAGPGADLRNATQSIRNAVRENGMGRTLGAVKMDDKASPADEARAQADEAALRTATEQVAASVVHFYAPFINEFADRMLASKGDLPKLTMSGEDIWKQVREWESKGDRPELSRRLWSYIERTMDGLRPQMPQIFDPVSELMVPAPQEATPFSAPPSAQAA